MAKAFVTPIASQVNNPAMPISCSKKRKANVSEEMDGSNKKQKVIDQGESSDEPKKQKAAKKQSTTKVVRNKASRMVRQQQMAASQSSESTESKKGRKRNLGNIVGDELSRLFKEVTLNIGTLTPCLQRGLNNNYANGANVNNFIRSTIVGMAKINTDLIRCGVMATFNYINTVMSEHPSISPQSSDIKLRNGKLKHIAMDGNSFFNHLVKTLYGNSGSSGTEEKEEDEENEAPGSSGKSTELGVQVATLFISTMGQKLDGLLKRIQGHVEAGVPAHFLEQIALTLANMIRCHIRAFVTELKIRVRYCSMI